MNRRPWWLSALLGAAVLGCGEPGPRALHVGEDVCSGCHMTIVDPAFAGQLVMKTGKVLVFDDLGELAAHAARTPAEEIHGLWAHRFLAPEETVPVDQAVFLQSDRWHTPMASGLAAFADRAAADSVQSDVGGRLLAWTDVLQWAADRAASPPTL